jgi:glycerol-3-phosphate dehydrogenase
LIKPKENSSSKHIVRSHEIELMVESGLVSVLGGKWTTYRAMAEDAVTQAVKSFGLPAKYASRTSDLKWISAYQLTPTNISEFSQEHRVDRATAHHLLQEYGAFVGAALARGRRVPLVQGHLYLESEVLFAIDYEFARTPTDVLSRRLRLTYQDYTAALTALPRVVELMATELNWDDDMKTVQEARSRAELSLHQCFEEQL